MLFASPGGAKVICTVITDADRGTVLEKSGVCDRRVTPASTFKIAISLMGYDSGFLVDEHAPALPFREGYPDWNPSWRSTTDPSSWIKNSVVWYSQEVTRSLGEDRFQRYVTQFHYGNENLVGNLNKHDGLTQAWLSSSLKISPSEQIAFLKLIVRRQLPIRAAAYDMTSRITAVAVLPNGWDVHGKTGTGFPASAEGALDEDRAYGWFVGWATKGERSIVFARLIQDEHPEAIRAGLRAREAFIQELPLILVKTEMHDGH